MLLRGRRRTCDQLKVERPDTLLLPWRRIFTSTSARSVEVVAREGIFGDDVCGCCEKDTILTTL